jgi:hypothetical protein
MNISALHIRLRNIKNPTTPMLEFADKIRNAGGVINVTPEYNDLNCSLHLKYKNVVNYWISA